MQIQIAFHGRQYDQSEALPAQLALPEGATVDDALDALSSRLAAGRSLSPSYLIAVSGTHLGTLRNHQPRQLRDGDELLVLAPVAGG